MYVNSYSNSRQSENRRHHEYLLCSFPRKDLCLKALESFLKLLCNFLSPVLAKGRKVLPPSTPNQWINEYTSVHICEFFLLKIWNYSKEGLRSKIGHLLISLREGKLLFLNAILWHQINVNRGKHLQSWHYFLFVQTPKSISDVISWRYSETNGNICCIYLYRKWQNIL